MDDIDHGFVSSNIVRLDPLRNTRHFLVEVEILVKPILDVTNSFASQKMAHLKIAFCSHFWVTNIRHFLHVFKIDCKVYNIV